jgi:hypothetical protein
MTSCQKQDVSPMKVYICVADTRERNALIFERQWLPSLKNVKSKRSQMSRSSPATFSSARRLGGLDLGSPALPTTHYVPNCAACQPRAKNNVDFIAKGKLPTFATQI